jgi:very-short-patch-repair endonuclease
VTDEILKKPTRRVRLGTRARAKALRADLTNAERIIWKAIRAHRLNGVGFRRQTPIGPYIVDFVSFAAKLVIELDSGQHYDNAHEARCAAQQVFALQRISGAPIQQSRRDDKS